MQYRARLVSLEEDESAQCEYVIFEQMKIEKGETSWVPSERCFPADVLIKIIMDRVKKSKDEGEYSW